MARTHAEQGAPTRSPLNRQRVLEAAIALADEGGSAALSQFLFRFPFCACHSPILEPLPGSKNECKPRFQPDVQRCKRECRGEIQRDSNQGGAKNVSANHIEVLDQCVADNAAQ